MKRLLCTLAGCLLLAAPAFAQVVEEVHKIDPEEAKRLAPFLTKDGNLTAPLEVRNELTGFGTFFGTIWRIESDGAWTITRILRKEPILIGKGQLTKGQILQLARSMVLFDPLKLPSVGRPVVNPHEITVLFGGNKATLTFGVDQVMPYVKPESLPVPASPLAPYVVSKNPPPPQGTLVIAPITRYAGLESAVKGLIQPNLGVKFDLPERLKQLGHP